MKVRLLVLGAALILLIMSFMIVLKKLMNFPDSTITINDLVCYAATGAFIVIGAWFLIFRKD